MRGVSGGQLQRRFMFTAVKFFKCDKAFQWKVGEGNVASPISLASVSTTCLQVE